jgi:hypothetical protein
VLQDAAAFNIAYRKARQKKKGGQVMVLCTKEEVAAPIAGIDATCRRMHFDQFLKSIRKPDETHTVSR